ncbi:hypothetical protein AWENTII_001021 [Aspergillus wentii]|nr:hypothetical protein MW887_001681 [Aspergillus wentii]
MSSIPDKRKPSGSISGDSPHAKRPRSYADDDADDAASSPSVTPYERPRNHPVYGQKSAFPGLDTGLEDELFYGPAEDGMEYLRMVRSEANSLPVLFTAPKTSETVVESTIQVEAKEETHKLQNPADTERAGTYVDGVYVGPVTNGDADKKTAQAATDTEEPYSEAQSSYYNLLRHRFLLLRSILKCTPPPSTIAGLDDSHPISLPRNSKVARKEWRHLLLAVDPQTVQLACMDMDSVLGVLEIMARLMSENVRNGDAERVRRIGAWAWGLLGKCREVGQLGTEEVAEIRDLGKRAIKILHKMREDERNRTAAEEDVSEPELDEENQETDHQPQAETGEPATGQDASDTITADVPDHDMQYVGTEPSAAEFETKLEEAKARLQAKVAGSEEPGQSTEVDMLDQGTEPQAMAEDSAVDVAMQTRAMLDMIITVVGEYFGQRDLLTAREIWKESVEE